MVMCAPLGRRRSARRLAGIGWLIAVTAVTAEMHGHNVGPGSQDQHGPKGHTGEVQPHSGYDGEE